MCPESGLIFSACVLGDGLLECQNNHWARNARPVGALSPWRPLIPPEIRSQGPPLDGAARGRLRSGRPALTVDGRRDTLRARDNAPLLRVGFQGLAPDKRHFCHKCHTCLYSAPPAALYIECPGSAGLIAARL